MFDGTIHIEDGTSILKGCQKEGFFMLLTDMRIIFQLVRDDAEAKGRE